MPSSTQSKGTFAFVSLGCPKNAIDSERMLGLLQTEGYRLVADPKAADFVVVNTCGFVETARDESLAVIREMIDLKQRGQTRGLIVSGCLAELQKEQLRHDCPEIDCLVGVFGREEIAKVADRLAEDSSVKRHQAVFRPAPIRPLPDHDRRRITPRHFAYLKISEGCDRLCTFCVIPKIRGKHASKPMEEVIREAREMVVDGVRELIVVAQDTTYYGMDLYGRPRLAELLAELDNVEGVDWIRLMYAYPMHVSDALIGTIAQGRHILPYLDLPLQHVNDTILRRMARRVTRSETEELLGNLRSRIDAITLRTAFITGFPGETDEQFEELVQFVAGQRFQRVGVFTYSVEADTPAARLPGHVPEEVKVQRRNRLMEVQQQIAFQWNQTQIGRTVDVLLDAPVPGQTTAWIGRTAADAPDVDAAVYVTGKGLQAGQFVPCEIVAAKDYDLIGVAVGRPW